MLFNSYPFLFLFLPVALIGYEIAGHFHRRAVVAWLGLASLAFYAWWTPVFLILLLSSIALNYLFAALISRQIPNALSTTVLLWTAIGVNLAALCYFKYLFPLLNYFSWAAGYSHRWTDVILPLGISFFTFTQIAFLVDLQQESAVQQDPLSYVLFVTFFPHLIAGPILHHKDIMPQFQQDRRYRLQWNDVSVGVTWFTMGLFKKVILADALAPTANVVFAAHGQTTVAVAWLGVFSYALQLYFDFSGYSDMACGLARMFSIDFPLNFSSPFKASNIPEFWTRWHMTLTQYITAYLFGPLSRVIIRRRQEQGKKISRKAQNTAEGFLNMIALPTYLTMLIAGVWHGAGVNFLIYGLLHGTYITVFYAWLSFIRKTPGEQMHASVWIKATKHVSAVALTFCSAVLADLFFRASTPKDAFQLLGRMIGLHVAGKAKLPPLEDPVRSLLILSAAAIIVWAFPNTQQILARYKPALQLSPSDGLKRWLPLYWAPTLPWSLTTGAMFMLALIHIQDSSFFLYFQF